MTVFRLHLWCFLLGFFVAALAATAHAAEAKKADPKAAKEAEENAKPKYERICKVDVNYLWRASPIFTKLGPQVAKEYYATVSEQGWVSEQIQEQLNTKLSQVRAQALRACHSAHQEEAGCISKKFSEVSKEFPRLDYLRRQLLFDAVRRDCSNYLGECVATEVTEMTCWMNVPPDAIVPNEPQIEVAQPANTEPPMEVTGESELEDADETAEPGADNAAQKTSNSPATARPVKKAKRKSTEAKSAKKELPPEIKKPPPPEDNPYSQPFSVQ